MPSKRGMNRSILGLWHVVIAILAACCAMAGPASGQSALYVRTTGSDTNDGRSASTAYRTIQKAVNSVSAASTTIWVAPGNYDEQVTLTNSTRKGATGSPITLAGDITGARFGVAAGAVTIRGGGTRAYGIQFDSCSYWRFENLTISGQTTGNAYSTTAAQGIVFDNCTFAVTSSWGLYLASCGDITVNACVFTRTASSRYCTYIYQTTGGRMTITNNRCQYLGSLYQSSGQGSGSLSAIIYGIIALPYYNGASTVTVQNNIVSDATYGVYCYMPYANSSSVVTVANNVAESCYYGTYIYVPSPVRSKVVNNIVGNSYIAYVYTPAGTVDSHLVYNIRANPCGSNWLSCSYLTAGTKTNIMTTVTPTYTNAAAGDFTLTGTVGIDQGASGGAPATDILGAARPTDGDGDGTPEFDLGPFESGASERRLRIVRWRETTRY